MYVKPPQMGCQTIMELEGLRCGLCLKACPLR